MRAVCALVVLCAAGCKPGSPGQPASEATTGARAAGDLLIGTAHAAGAGTIKGKVLLVGKAPERKDIVMKADPYCAKQPPTKEQDAVVGAGGQIKNVVVRVA